jgi:hypothetical protein
MDQDENVASLSASKCYLFHVPSCFMQSFYPGRMDCVFVGLLMVGLWLCWYAWTVDVMICHLNFWWSNWIYDILFCYTFDWFQGVGFCLCLYVWNGAWVGTFALN